MAYLPIENHGVIGDLHTAALVGNDGTIDWCCLPRFDSPSVFGSLLDDRKGGSFQISPTQPGRTKQLYLPDTNVLITRFMSDEGVAEILDFMTVDPDPYRSSESSVRQIVRIVHVIRGEVRFSMRCAPAFDYARAAHELHLQGDRLAVFNASEGHMVLNCTTPLVREDNAIRADFCLRAGARACFSLEYHSTPLAEPAEPQPLDGSALLARTVAFWRGWIARSRYRGRWREQVHRSALALKLLSYAPTGAIIAAPTTSLPEYVGGPRNWDYRYTWVRDAAFTIYAFMRLGFTQEAGAFIQFMQARAKEEEPVAGPLNVMYRIDGGHDITEFTLDHLDGYRGSKPVRAGNSAFGHLQLDIYGELLDSLYLYDKYGTRTSYDTWLQIERMLDWVSKHWEEPDQSIWEVRAGRQQFTYSKLQCWVALDRGLRLASKRSLPINGSIWREQRDRIYRTIMDSAWNQQQCAFTQYYGSSTVDASVLLMPMMLFISPTDPRMLSTLKRVQEELVSDALVWRYAIGKAAKDGLPGGEGTFAVCSFWLAEALARSGMVDEAQLVFEKMMTYANNLGLFSEEVGAEGQALGNFPQALTHLGLISAAFNLDRQLDNASDGQSTVQK